MNLLQKIVHHLTKEDKPQENPQEKDPFWEVHAYYKKKEDEAYKIWCKNKMDEYIEQTKKPRRRVTNSTIRKAIKST